MEVYYLTAENLEEAKNHPHIQAIISSAKWAKEESKEPINKFDVWERIEFFELPYEIDVKVSELYPVHYENEVGYGFWND